MIRKSKLMMKYADYCKVDIGILYTGDEKRNCFPLNSSEIIKIT